MNAGYWRTVVGWWSSRGSIHGSRELRTVGPLRLSANRQWSTGDRHGREGVAIGPEAVGLLSRRSPEEAAYQRACVGKVRPPPRRTVAHRSVPGADVPGRLAEPKSCARHFVRTPAAGRSLRRRVISVPGGHRQSTASTEAGDPEAIMTDMQYVAPTTLEEAIGAFAAAGSAARILAGGTDLLVQMRSGIVKLGLIVDIKKIAEMTEIAETADGGFRIGAAVSGANLAEHPRFREVWPGVLEAVNLIGSKQGQGRASAGGNLCNASPAGDSVPAMIAADAVVTVQGPNGRRELEVEKVTTGPGRTNLAPGEILVSL